MAERVGWHGFGGAASRSGAARFRPGPSHGIMTGMGERGGSSLIVGVVAGLLLTGLPYWRLPYNADFLADTPVRIGFAGLALIAALLAATPPRAGKRVRPRSGRSPLAA